MKPKGPPYDGKPCPMCPIEIRNLHAVAHNYVNVQRGRSMSSDTSIDDLERAVEAVKPLAEAHFADRMHSNGEVGTVYQVTVNGHTYETSKKLISGAAIRAIDKTPEGYVLAYDTDPSLSPCPDERKIHPADLVDLSAGNVRLYTRPKAGLGDGEWS